jgi:antitoxin (DNA-binding transcriptional repressor) of toxin-antitoxin stability system
MLEMTIGQARDNFSQLIKHLQEGSVDEYVIKNRERPVARILPVEESKPKIKLGLYDDDPGVIDYDAFDAMDEEIADLFGVAR